MHKPRLLKQALTGSVIGAFYEVYNTLGFGFLEQIYLRALSYELLQRGHRITRELRVAVIYKGMLIARQRIDLIVDDELVVEIKSGYDLHRAARRQLYNYLRGTRLDLGLLLHFGPKPVFHRIICDTTGGEQIAIVAGDRCHTGIAAGGTDETDSTDETDRSG